MGYLLNDKRGAGGPLLEYDTVSCKHCQAVIKIVHGQKQGAWCNNCGGPVCNTQQCATACVPFLEKIEQKLRAQALHKALGLQ